MNIYSPYIWEPRARDCTKAKNMASDGTLELERIELPDIKRLARSVDDCETWSRVLHRLAIEGEDLPSRITGPRRVGKTCIQTDGALVATMVGRRFVVYETDC